MNQAMSERAIEAAAKAICELYKNSTDETWERYRRENSWKQFRPQAEAALAAGQRVAGEDALLRLGRLAVEMERLDLSCRQWFLASKPQWHSISTAPDWQAYQVASKAFHNALYDLVRDAPDYSPVPEAALALSPGKVEGWREGIKNALRQHWLTGIECDHAAKTDTTTCSCALWKSEAMPSVGAAVDAWIEHVMEFAISSRAEDSCD